MPVPSLYIIDMLYAVQISMTVSVRYGTVYRYGIGIVRYAPYGAVWDSIANIDFYCHNTIEFYFGTGSTLIIL